MKPERIQERLKILAEEGGWRADAEPRAIEKTYRLPSYSDALTLLVDVGA